MSRRYTLQDEATLVDQLNHLLHSLALPLSLISPTDLTPRLLIAILESLLGARLPIIQVAARDSQSPSPDADARNARVQHMKIFLGVLETDILQRDAGLSTVDPRRLAEGDDDAVFYVAEVLCSISRDRDRELAHAQSIPLPRTPSPPPSPSLSPSPVSAIRPPLSPKSQLDLDAESLFQTRSTTHQPHPHLFAASASPLLAHEDNYASTSLFSDHHEDEYGRASDDGGYTDDDSDTGVSDILGALPPSTPPPPPALPLLSRRLQRGRDASDEDDSLLFSAVNVDNPPIPRERAFSAYHHDPSVDNEGTAPLLRRPPVRYDGFIAPVDEEQELSSFERSRSLSRSISIESQSQSRGLGRQSHSHSVKAQYTRTLELLNERARLLAQLSELRGSSAGHARGYGYEYGYGHG